MGELSMGVYMEALEMQNSNFLMELFKVSAQSTFYWNSVLLNPRDFHVSQTKIGPRMSWDMGHLFSNVNRMVKSRAQ